MKDLKKILKDGLKPILDEARNINPNITGTSVNKLPTKIKDILVDKLHISTYNLQQIFFDNHLKQLMIILKPNQFLDKTKLQVLNANPDFVGIGHYMDNGIDGIVIQFKYKPVVKKKNETDEFKSDLIEEPFLEPSELEDY